MHCLPACFVRGYRGGSSLKSCNNDSNAVNAPLTGTHADYAMPNIQINHLFEFRTSHVNVGSQCVLSCQCSECFSAALHIIHDNLIY